MKNRNVNENLIKRKTLNEKNFLELEKYFQILIKNFGEVKDEDKNILNISDSSENFIISNFKQILNRRVNNGEPGILFFIEEIKRNKKIFKIFEKDVKQATKSFNTDQKFFFTIQNVN